MKTIDKVVSHRVIDIVKALGLPDGEYIVTGSAIMEVFGIKNAPDIDILVTPGLFKRLTASNDWQIFRKYGVNFIKYLPVYGSPIEAICEWSPKLPYPGMAITDLIKAGKEICGVYFVPLQTLINIKQNCGRAVDIEDVKLIKEYISSRPFKSRVSLPK